MIAADLPALRQLIRLRRAAGWTIAGPYGERGYRQHVYREPTEPAWSGAKLCVEPDRLEYRRRVSEAHPGASFTLAPESMADVLGWLRLLGLLPTVAQVAEALLDADGADERSSSTEVAGALSDRHMTGVGA